MSGELRLRQRSLHWREVEQEILALEADSSTYLASNASGALLWPLLAEGTTRDALVEALVEEYGIEQEQAAADVDRFVAELDAHALLER